MKKILLIVAILLTQIVANNDSKSMTILFDVSKEGCSNNDDKSAYWCDMLGVIYLLGEGVKQDFDEAKRLFIKSCRGGHSIGCYNLAHIYFKGKGVEQDDYKAVMIYKKACSLRNHKACLMLGHMTAEGRGTRQDVSKAKEYFGKACDFGNNTGCKIYKLLNENGI